MATVNVVFSTVGGPSGAIGAYNAEPLSSENVTSSVTSAQSAAAPADCAVRIATNADIYVKAGSNPTASAGNDWLVQSGTSLDLFVNAGSKIAVIDA